MIDFKKEEPAGPAFRKFLERGGFRRAIEKPGLRRREKSGRKTEAHQRLAGYAGGPGVRRRAIVKGTRVDGELNIQQGKENQKCEDGAGLLPLSFFHRAHDIL
jgi:hypothetical protein